MQVGTFPLGYVFFGEAVDVRYLLDKEFQGYQTMPCQRIHQWYSKQILAQSSGYLLLS